MNYITFALCCLFCLASLNTTEANAPANILTLYQPESQMVFQKKELKYWQDKLDAAPGQFAFQQKLAQANTALFASTAEIRFLKRAEQLLKELSQKNLPNRAAVLRSLAHNLISQHRFCEALDLVVEALSTGDGRRTSELMLFDLYEELGDQENQILILNRLSVQKDFNYLIRLAKWEDGQGRLDNTIELMKRAEQLAESSNQQQQISWVCSNLGDYYGHAGEIKRSKHYFIKSLKLNPADWYSLKGLAWIAYAHEDRPQQALNWLKGIKAHCNSPSVLLLEAEISEYQGDKVKADELRKKVFKTVTKPSYGSMYRHFLFDYYADEAGRPDLAMDIAKQEIAERPVPASYDLLARAFFLKGEVAEAQAISRQHILDNTHEPAILLNQLCYFSGAADPKIEFLKTVVKEAKFEIGPLNFKRFLNCIES